MCEKGIHCMVPRRVFTALSGSDIDVRRGRGMTSFSAVRVLGIAIQLWLKNFVSFTLVTAICVAPLIAWKLICSLGASLPSHIIVTGLSATVGMSVIMVTGAAVSHGVVEAMRGHPAAFVPTVRMG